MTILCLKVLCQTIKAHQSSAHLRTVIPCLGAPNHRIQTVSMEGFHPYVEFGVWGKVCQHVMMANLKEKVSLMAPHWQKT